MSPGEEDAIRELTGKVGNLEGAFDGLKDHVTSQADACRSNYEDLSSSFDEVRKALNGRIVEEKIKKAERNAVYKEKGRCRKILESRVTLICVVVMALAATVTVIEMRSDKHSSKNHEKVYSSVDAREERLEKLITALESRLGEPVKQPEE